MDDQRSPYLQVADMLRASIQTGTLQAGDRLPSVTELAASYNVAKMTVQRAIGVLRDEGLVVSWQGRGTFVRDRGSESAAQPVDYATIMQRLDEICDTVERFEERLSRLEQDAAEPRQRQGDDPAS